MKKLYTQILAYNPTEDVVTVWRAVNTDSNFYNWISDEIFLKVFALTNHTTDIVLGKTIGGDFYQLSPTPYGGYIKEDSATVNRYINKSKLLCAIARYKKEKKIPFDR